MKPIAVPAFLAACSVFILLSGGCNFNAREESAVPASSRMPAAASTAARDASPPLFDGMGPHRRTVSTRSPEAQRYFNQALVWTFAFNHDEAIRSYKKAAELDPNLAIAWWGVALANGPHINFNALPEDRAKAAWEALQKAQSLKANASPIERALIEAVAQRYAWPAPSDRAALDKAYAAAMKAVHEKFPEDADVGTLYAESLMDLQPWDMWTKDGRPKGNTLEIVRVIEQVLKLDPAHPGATHMYIHAVEASPAPGRAKAAADALRNQVTASGHLLHMPSHIDIRLGDWKAAVDANRRAIATDTAYRRISPRQGFYNAYMMHNQQFLAFACMMAGRSEEAMRSAQDAIAILPEDWVKQNASVADGYIAMRMDALKRFGKWDQILATQAPPDYLPYTTAMWRFNRATALAATGKTNEAQAERELFKLAAAKVPQDARAQINPAHRVLDLAAHFLDGEIAYAKKDYAQAEKDLREAAKIEDSLQYMEPPDWSQPVRHTLGVVLMDAGRFADAEQTYQDDLKHWPENGWSLLGLAKAQEKQGKTDAAKESRSRLDRVWADADVKPKSSCLCSHESR